MVFKKFVAGLLTVATVSGLASTQVEAGSITDVVSGLTKETIEMAEKAHNCVSVELNSAYRVRESFDSLAYNLGYVNATSLHLRELPSKDSKSLAKMTFNTTVQYAEVEGTDDWYAVCWDGKTGYASSRFITSDAAVYHTVAMPVTSGKKTFMFSESITSWKQAELKAMTHVGQYGIMQYNDRFCVALGTGTGCEVGQYFDLVLNNGTVIPCVVADIKRNRDTDSSNLVTLCSGCCSEFVVSHQISDKAMTAGDVSKSCPEWNSPVKEVRLYDKNALQG